MSKMEFEEFNSADPMSPPQGISERIFARVHMDLNPSAWKVFSKLSVIHFVTALATLSVCPQFGFRLFGQGMGLMGYFMHLGEVGCTVACGTFFLGSSVLVAMMLLRPEEIRAIRSHRLLGLGALTLLSVGFFIMLQADFVLGFYLAWAVGSLLGGILTLEAAWLIRLRLLKVTG
jgi:hypothetical protein